MIDFISNTLLSNSIRLIELAKRAVEVAIEEGEEKAMVVITTNL